jgi:hypothetical protein
MGDTQSATGSTNARHHQPKGEIVKALIVLIVVCLIGLLGADLIGTNWQRTAPLTTPACEGKGETSFCHISEPDGSEWLFTHARDGKTIIAIHQKQN